MSLRKVFLGTFSEMVAANETVATAQVQAVTTSENDGRRQTDGATQPPEGVKRKTIRRVTRAASAKKRHSDFNFNNWLGHGI